MSATKKAAPKAKKKGRVDVDRSRESLEHLGLEMPPIDSGRSSRRPSRTRFPTTGFSAGCVKPRSSSGMRGRIVTSPGGSGLRTGYTLADYDWALQPSVKESRIETLATCAWIREQETVLLQGPPDIGKTHPAVALGVKTVENGFSVAFFRLEDLLHALKKDAEVPARSLRRRRYMKVALLIIDEVGFQPLDRQEASLLFRLVSVRYEKGSIPSITSKAIKDWPEVLAGDEVMATALLDRLLHRCHVLNIKAAATDSAIWSECFGTGNPHNPKPEGSSTDHRTSGKSVRQLTSKT